MKCQYCEKPATFHITELTGDEPVELHFCEEHARIYLTQSDEPEESAPSLAGVLAPQLKVGQTAEDLAKLDQRACPVCGVTFYEFRHAGRLGCPHDYVCLARSWSPDHEYPRGDRARGQAAASMECEVRTIKRV